MGPASHVPRRRQMSESCVGPWVVMGLCLALLSHTLSQPAGQAVPGYLIQASPVPLDFIPTLAPKIASSLTFHTLLLDSTRRVALNWHSCYESTSLRLLIVALLPWEAAHHFGLSLQLEQQHQQSNTRNTLTTLGLPYTTYPPCGNPSSLRSSFSNIDIVA